MMTKMPFEQSMYQLLTQNKTLNDLVIYLKNEFKAEEIYFYEIKYKKPYYFPKKPEFNDLLTKLKEHPTKFSVDHKDVHVYRLSNDCFIVLTNSNHQPLNPSELMCIDIVYKTMSYQDYAQFLAMILDFSPDMIAYKDTDNIFRYANKEASNRWPGIDTIFNKHISEIYPVDEAQRVIAMDKVAYEANKPVKTFIDFLAQDGYLTVETTRIPVSENGVTKGILTINKDITGIRNIEKELKRAYDFQDILIQIASLFINVPAEKADEAINKGLGMVGSHIQADRVYVFDYDFNTGLTSNTHEWCAEGIVPVIEYLQNQPISSIDAFWMDSHLKHESVYIHDIETLNHESELYKTLLMQDIKSLLTIPLYDQYKVYGFVGFDSVKQFAHWTDDEQQLLKVLAEIIVNLKVREIQQNQLVLEKQNALKASDAKGEFLANMSHEIRTPISGITNALYLLKNTTLTEEQNDYLEIAKSSVESLSRIVNNILDISKIEAGKLELEMSSFDLETEIYQVIKIQEFNAIEKGIRLVFDFDYSILDEVITDRTRFRQIILNLVSNAVKYTESGKVTVKATKLAQEDHTLTIKFEVIDTGIGIPRKILSKITDPFFQVDGSLTKKYSGTGLGLTIVKNLLELLGSKLEIESQVGIGSNFGFVMKFTSGIKNPYQKLTGLQDKKIAIIDSIHSQADVVKHFFNALSPNVDIYSAKIPHNPVYDFIFIEDSFEDIEAKEIDQIKKKLGRLNAKIVICSLDPSSRSKPELKDKHIDYVITMPTTRERVHQLFVSDHKNLQKPVSDQSIFKNKKVMVVDDNKVNRQAMQVILSKAGLNVILASSGSEAIDRAQLMSVDIILMDIQMPEMDGYEAAEKIRALKGKFSKIPIIAVTANATEAANAKAIASGMNKSITKPFKPEVLLELIKYQLEEVGQQNVNLCDLEDINEQSLLIAYENDHALIYEILSTFAEDYIEQIANLKKAMSSESYIDIERIAHYLKGSTNYIFAEKAAKTCQDIMTLVKNGQFNSVYSKATLLLEELKAVYDIIIERDFFRN